MKCKGIGRGNMKKESAVSKGKDFEREIAKDIEEYLGGRAYPSHSPGSSDVKCIGNILSRVHIECKRHEKIGLEQSYGQSLRAARGDEVPIVITRRTRDVSMVYMAWEDFLSLMEELQNATM